MTPPGYHWYLAKQPIECDYQTIYVNGRQYIALVDEASYEQVEKHDLREVGFGDIEYVRGVK